MRPALFNIIRAPVPEADLLIDYMTVRPQGNRAFLISDTIRRLKYADVFPRFDVLWMPAAHHAQAGLLNWKDPSRFALTEVNSPPHTVDRGYASNGSSSYLRTGFVPFSNGVNLVANSASILARTTTSRSAADWCLIGANIGSTGAGINIFNRAADGTAVTRANDDPGTAGFTNSNSAGFYHGDRQSSTARTAYRNGVSLGNYGSSAAGLSTREVYICALNYNGGPLFYSTDRLSFAALGGSLDSKAVEVYNIIERYCVGIGA